MIIVTDLPRPDAVLYSDETEMKLHVPRKLDRIMLLVKIEARKMMNGLIAGAAFMSTPPS
jgi:hypothetical protein